MSQFARRHIVPLLYTLLWSIGLLLCGREFTSHNMVWVYLEHGTFFIAVLYIYVVFLLECFLGLFDKALEHLKAQFNVNLLFFFCAILIDIGCTLWLSFLFIFENEAYSEYFVYILTLMMFLKLLTSWFSNNIDKFMVKLHIDTIQSVFVP